MRIRKKDVECGEPPNEVALVALEAVALEHDGLDGAAVVVAGREHGHGERTPPPVQEWEQVVHEGEAAVGGEGDGLVAVERLGAADVVVEDPVLLAPGVQFNRHFRDIPKLVPDLIML